MNKIVSNIKTRITKRVLQHPLYSVYQEFVQNRYLGFLEARNSAPLRKPEKPFLSYRFKAQASDEEHRTYKLIDGKYEEYTKIERGFYPGYSKMASEKFQLITFLSGTFGGGMLFTYLALYWFVREPLRNLFYKLDRKRIEFERVAEMEELIEEEQKVREMAGEHESAAHVTADYVHSNKDISGYHVWIKQKGEAAGKWSIDIASQPTKQELREMYKRKRSRTLSAEEVAIETKLSIDDKS